MVALAAFARLSAGAFYSMQDLLTKLDALLDQQARMTDGLHALAESVAALANMLAQEGSDDGHMPASLDEL